MIKRERIEITLPTEVIKEIKNFKKKYKFVFSQWVEETFIKEFMNVESRKNKLNNMILEVEKLKNEIFLAEDKIASYKKLYNTNECRWLVKVPYMISQGSNLTGLCQVFNEVFNRDLSPAEFNRAVKEVKYSFNRTQQY